MTPDGGQHRNVSLWQRKNKAPPPPLSPPPPPLPPFPLPPPLAPLLSPLPLPSSPLPLSPLLSFRRAPRAARRLRHLIGDATPALMEKAPEPELDRPRRQPPGARCAEVAPGQRARRVLDDGGPGVDGLAGQHALVHAQIVARHALRAELLQHMRLAGAPVEAVVAPRLGQHGGPGR